MKLAASVLLLIVLQASLVCPCHAAETDPNILAAGAWSQPVGNSNGLKLRGRLLIYAYPSETGANPALYVELQDFSNSVGAVQQVYWDPGGLKCEMTDRGGKAVPESGGAFGGGVPGAMWIKVPTNSTIRLRVTPYAGGGKLSSGGFAVWAALPQTWELKAGDTNSYFLSGVFKSKPPKPSSDDSQWIWSGTLKLPKMELSVKKLRDTKEER